MPIALEIPRSGTELVNRSLSKEFLPELESPQSAAVAEQHHAAKSK